MIIDQLFTRPIFESQMDPITQFASNAHEEWRRNFDPTGTKPRIKKNSDGTEGDINVPFADLHPDWQKENLAAGRAAQHAVKHFGNNMEKAAEFIHRQWMKRNPKADYNAAQHVPYDDLSDDEKEKDRVHVRTMMRLIGHQLNEFAPSDDGEGPDQEEILRRLAAHWWNGNEHAMTRVEHTLAAMGWEIGEDDGYDEGGVFVVRAGDEHGRTYTSWSAEELDMNEAAPPGAKAERMVRHIKQGYAKDGKLTPKEKGIAFATAWKAHNAGQVEESTDPKRAKLGRMIYKYFGQIYDYGDDDGLNYLDEQGELWNQLMDKYNGEIDDIVAQEPLEVLMRAAQELKHIAGDMKYELDEQGVVEGEVTKNATGLKHRATDKYGAGDDEPHHYTGGRSGFSEPGKYARDLEHVNKQLVKDLDASMGISWKNRGPKGLEVDEQGVTEGEYDSRKPFGVRYKVFAGREGRVTTREYWTSSEEKLQRAVAKIEALDNFYEIDGYSYPKEPKGVAEGVAETVSMDQAKKVLRHYGADHFKTTTNELHFYKNGRPMSVDLIFNDDATRSVNLSQLNSATRRLKGQGVAKGQQIDEVFADQGSGSTDRDNADYMKKRRAAKKAAGSNESYMIIRTDAEGKRDVFAGNFDTYERAQKELDGLLAHPLHTKHKQKFEIKRKGQKDITEMDKSEPSAGRDTGPRSGPDKEAKPISKEKMTKDAGGMLNRAFKDSHKKKDVKESDSLMMKLKRAMVQEGRVKELADDLKTLADADFMKKYGKAKAAIRADMKRVDEAGSSRLGKKDIDFRTGLDVGDEESEFFEPDVRIGKPVEPNAADTDAFMSAVNSEKNPYMQSWGGKYADQDTRIAPLRPGEFNAGGTTWRFLTPGEKPGSDTISGTGTPDWRSIAAAGKPAAAGGLPKMRFDRATNSLVPVDAPPALDLSPKDKDKFDRQTRSVKPADGSGANANIDNATRDRALAYAAQQNAPAAAKQKVDWKAIYALNKATIGSNPNVIRPRMELNMPNGTIYQVQPGDTLTKIAAKQNQVNELSTNKLAQYKTAAAQDAQAADKAGDFKRGDKRLSGMVAATKKQFDNDAKQVDESRAARRALMARIVNHR
jgi:hypothetical protein